MRVFCDNHGLRDDGPIPELPGPGLPRRFLEFPALGDDSANSRHHSTSWNGDGFVMVRIGECVWSRGTFQVRVASVIVGDWYLRWWSRRDYSAASAAAEDGT